MVKYMTAEAAPLRTAPIRRDEGALRVFSRSASTPALQARYRLEWRFRARPQRDTTQGEFR